MVRRSLSSCMPLSLALAMSAALWGAAPASAQTMTVLSTTTRATSTSSTTTATTTAALVSLTGIVTGGLESISFSGQAKVTANVVTDPDFGNTPTVVLTIDLSSLTGQGASTGATYVTSQLEIVQRRLAAVDAVQYTFPFYRSDGSAMSPRIGLASFNLSYDVNSLILTGVIGSIGTP